MPNQKGMVHLVGAGPGNPELITQKGIRLLQKADVVLYDFLVHPNLLNHCKSDCEHYCVGKKKGFHSTEQEKINELMINAAKSGKDVVRLKGGDPFIFGRAGEELSALIQENINFECVPGVSSAIAVPEYAGIPLTHRDTSRSVAFVTGTLKRGDTHLDIPEADTIVFLMALSKLEHIVKHLLACSRFTANTAITIITHGTAAKQEQITGNLSSIVEKSTQLKHHSPALIIVGDVVELSDSFNWFSKLPLFGKRFILTRPGSQNEKLASELLDLGAEVLVHPLISISPIQSELAQIDTDLIKQTSNIVFTSQNAVQLFFEHLNKKNIDIRSLAHCQISCVGTKTANALKEHGIIADITAHDQSQQGLLETVNQDLSTKQLLIPIAKEGAQLLKDECEKRGASVTQLCIYEQMPSNKRLEIEPDDTIIVSSGTLARTLLEISSIKHTKPNVLVYGKSAMTVFETEQYKQVSEIKEINADCILNNLN